MVAVILESELHCRVGAQSFAYTVLFQHRVGVDGNSGICSEVEARKFEQQEDEIEINRISELLVGSGFNRVGNGFQTEIASGE